MKIAITAESTIDLPEDLLTKYDIKTIPYTILLGDKVGFDGKITPQEIFDFVDKNKVLPKTSAVNEYQYVEFFNEVKKDYDAIVHITLSSQISSSYNNAVLASGQINNVFIVDSKSLSTGIALLAIKARSLASEGYAPEEIAKTVEECTKRVQASFVLNKLDYLRKGGRCSSIMLLGANLLHIIPQIVLKDGKMISGKKYRGNFHNCVKSYCEDTLKQFPNGDKSLAFVTYTSASDETVAVAHDALERAGFKQIYHTLAGATIASHCGPNTLGILFLNKE